MQSRKNDSLKDVFNNADRYLAVLNLELNDDYGYVYTGNFSERNLVVISNAYNHRRDHG